MKFTFTLLIILSSFGLIAQKKNGYVQVGPVGYLRNSSTLIGACLGAGSIKGKSGFGIGIEALSQKDNGFFVPIYFDARVYFKSSGARPFLTFQPGFVARNRSIAIADTRIKNTGGIYLSGGVGFISMLSKYGTTFQLKYSMISTKVTTQNTNPNSTVSTKNFHTGFLGLFFGIAI